MKSAKDLEYALAEEQDNIKTGIEFIIENEDFNKCIKRSYKSIGEALEKLETGKSNTFENKVSKIENIKFDISKILDSCKKGIVEIESKDHIFNSVMVDKLKGELNDWEKILKNVKV